MLSFPVRCNNCSGKAEFKKLKAVAFSPFWVYLFLKI